MYGILCANSLFSCTYTVLYDSFITITCNIYNTTVHVVMACTYLRYYYRCVLQILQVAYERTVSSDTDDRA